MIYIKTLVICIVSVFFLTGNFIPKSDVFAQVISNNLEESDVYIQLSNILDNTEKNLFRSPEQFDAMVERDEFLEHARFLGRAYGTPRAAVEAALSAGRDVLFDIEWQGHRQLKARMPEDVVGIFLLPPSLAVLEQRLRGRGQDSEEEVRRRMAVAREEIAHWDEFDHVLVNEDFAATVAAVRAILHAARTRPARLPWLPGFVGGLLSG